MLALVAAILALAAAIRIASSRNELWLDEVWSLEMARQVASPVEIFTVAKHDNNHFLNTLWLYAVRGHDAPVVLRAHSIVAGVLTVLVAWLVARRWGRAAGILAAVFTACSYPMLLYASEARGYALAACLGLLAFLLLERYVEGRRPASAALFCAVSILGFLSHLTFLHVYVGLAAWSIDRWRRERPGSGEIGREVLACHAAPLLGLAALWWTSLRGRVVGGGTEPGVGGLDGVLDAASLLVGGPLHGIARAVCAVLALALTLRGLQVVARREGGFRGPAVFLAVAALASPAVLTPLLSPGFLFPRYFLVSASLAILLVAAALADAWERRGATRVAAASAAVLVVLGGAEPAAGLLRYGRGQYEEPLRLVAERGAPGPLAIAGDHELRVGFVLAHYAKRTLPGREVLYRNAPAGPPAGVAGFIAHSLDPDPTAPAAIRGEDGRAFHRIAIYRHAPLSGVTWLLYAP
jgi:hypothetical protein